VCDGAGKVQVPGDIHAQRLFCEIMGLINRKGVAQIQQNFGTPAPCKRQQRPTIGVLAMAIAVSDPPAILVPLKFCDPNFREVAIWEGDRF